MSYAGLSEHTAQVLICNWLDMQYPDLVFFAVPNGARLGGHTDAQRYGIINKLKAEGLTPGAPDLVILAPRGNYHACLLEMKKEKGGRLSENQKEFLARAEQAGYYTIVGRGYDQARELLEEYLSWEKP